MSDNVDFICPVCKRNICSVCTKTVDWMTENYCRQYIRHIDSHKE